MNSLSFAVLLLSLVCMASAGRRYIAIPVDGVDVIEVSAVVPAAGAVRLPRQTEAYVPVAIPNMHHDDIENQRTERSTAHVLDYVDFGGHTGTNGAFSWYADYPAHH